MNTVRCILLRSADFSDAGGARRAASNEREVVSAMRNWMGGKHFADTILQHVKSETHHEQYVRVTNMWLHMVPIPDQLWAGMTINLYAHTEVQDKLDNNPTLISSKSETSPDRDSRPGTPFMIRAQAKRGEGGIGWSVPIPSPTGLRLSIPRKSYWIQGTGPTFPSPRLTRRDERGREGRRRGAGRSIRSCLFACVCIPVFHN